MPYFEILKKDSSSKARNGQINTAHGEIHTPAFLPIGTKGTVKAVTSEELKFWGAEIILANTYHLWQRPGDTLIYKAGGRAEILSPEKSVDIQANLGSDIALILDDFPGYPFEYERSKQSIALTRRWAERAIKEYQKIIIDGDPINPGQKLWGIVQGASFPDLRKQSAQDMVSLGFEAFAIGGVAVGEPHKDMMLAVEAVIPHLPENSPKHLLGVGTPFDIVQAVSRGCDTFDCVIPTREARHGKLYVSAQYTVDSTQKVEGYATLNIDNEKYKEDFTTIDNTCDCYLCLNHSKSYLRHLFASGEPLGIRLATMHNLKFYLNLMKKIREAITYDYFQDMVKYYKEIKE